MIKKILGIVTDFLRKPLQKASFYADIDLLAEIGSLTVLKKVSRIRKSKLEIL